MDLCILVSVSELLHNLSISKYKCGIKLYIDKISVQFNFFLIHVLVVLPGTMPVPLEDCSSLSAPSFAPHQLPVWENLSTTECERSYKQNKKQVCM